MESERLLMFGRYRGKQVVRMSWGRVVISLLTLIVNKQEELMSNTAELHQLVTDLADALNSVEQRISDLAAQQEANAGATISDLDLAALRDDVAKAKSLSANAVATSTVVNSGGEGAGTGSSPTPPTPSTGDTSGDVGVEPAPVPPPEPVPAAATGDTEDVAPADAAPDGGQTTP
jgi:hypothetical protein